VRDENGYARTCPGRGWCRRLAKENVADPGDSYAVSSRSYRNGKAEL